MRPPPGPDLPSMPRAAKNDKKASPPAAETPSFEEALARLERLVEEMESDEVPLEELLRKYEEGTALYHLCEQRLDEARGRIEILRKKRNGEAVLEVFGDDAEAPDAEPGAPQQDGELF